MKSTKVKIFISEGHNYYPSIKNGVPYISVDFQGSTYGGASPCDTEDEIQATIRNTKKGHSRLTVTL